MTDEELAKIKADHDYRTREGTHTRYVPHAVEVHMSALLDEVYRLRKELDEGDKSRLKLLSDITDPDEITRLRRIEAAAREVMDGTAVGGCTERACSECRTQRREALRAALTEDNGNG